MRRSMKLSLICALMTGGLWLCYSRWGQQSQAAAQDGGRRSQLEAALFASSYRFEDAKVEEGTSTGAEGAPGKVDSLDIRKAYERAGRLAAQTQGKVFKATLAPNWFASNTHFWYRNDLRDGKKEFILVNAETGKRGPAFDHARLAAALSMASSAEHKADRLPFSRIEISDDLKTVLFQVGEVNWRCDLGNYKCERADRAPKQESSPSDEEENAIEVDEEDVVPLPDDLAPQQKKGFFKGKGKKQGGGPPAIPLREAKSPNGMWTAFIKDNNVHLRDKDGKETALTMNGEAGNAYSSVMWSPDSKTILSFRTEPGDNKQVYLIESSPRDQLPAKFSQRPYPRPGDKFSLYELWTINVESKQPVKADVERIDYGRPSRIRWSKDGKSFTFEKVDRGHQRFRFIEVDAETGKTRNIIDEKTDTFIWTVHAPSTGLMGVSVQHLDTSNEILFVSQRDGWKHIYLVDPKTGDMKQITKGQWVVRAIDRIDEANRQIWFRASGVNPKQDPYFIHYYRVNFDGSGFVALTEGDGNHRIEYSPDRKYLVDTYSRVDMAPVHELRRVSDGKLVCKLEDADISALLATGWKAPEVFVAKGRDGRTDIWGIVCRPQNYDPGKKYPIIEYIYAGPHDSFVPKTFAAFRSMQALAELGFIVVQCDGMGTANRSKAFHDVCWQNLADAGFPDRILWIKALATKYQYMDISRVGIYGTSAGGQSSTAALLFHPDFYKVAVSSCGCHDNRLDKFSWNEQWMGLLGPHYENQSNVTNAHKLVGKLLLIVGELDTNVPPESTLRVVDALIRARKDFDFLFVPGMGHSGGGTYGDRRRYDFFVRHLHGIEPPDRNTASGGRAE